jgi:hypothetical protein
MDKIYQKAVLILCIIFVLSFAFAGCSEKDERTYALKGLPGQEQYEYMVEHAIMGVMGGGFVPIEAKDLNKKYTSMSGKAVLDNNEVYAWTTRIERNTLVYDFEYIGYVLDEESVEIDRFAQDKTDEALKPEVNAVADFNAYVYLNQEEIRFCYDIYGELNEFLHTIQVVDESR